jgi:hypothetical protein
MIDLNIIFMKYYFLFSSFLLLIACNHQLQTNDIEIEVDYKNLQEIKLSDYVKNVKIVKLETSDKVLIGEIWQIKLFDHKIFIIDMVNKSLFVFTEDGEFLHELRKIGQGPGEYLSLFDFYPSDEGVYLLTYSNSGHSILYYDWNWNYINNISFKWFSTVFMMHDEYFILFNEDDFEQNNQISLIDMTGKLVKQFFPRDKTSKNNNYASSNTLLEYYTAKYFSPRHGNILYKLNEENEWEKFIRISFGNKTYKGDINQLDNVYEEEFEYIIRYYYFMLKDVFVFNFINDPIGTIFCFYNIKTKQIATGKVKNDLIPNYNRFYPLYQSGDYLIEKIYANDILSNYKELCDFDNSLKTLIDDDNPVLLIYECK